MMMFICTLLSISFLPFAKLVVVQKQCNGAVCHPNAECIHDICACKSGFHGDGINQCKKKCICEVVGDPHIYGFDGHFMTFPGRCRYTMAKTTTINDTCEFNIEIKNDNSGASGDPDMQSSWVKNVFIETQGFSVELKRGRTIVVDGHLRYLPVHMSSPKGYLVIVHNGPWVSLVTSCGLHVKWDSDSTVKVEAPDKYIGKLTGLCGNCNGVPEDDFKTSDGKDVSKQQPNVRDLIVGDSYLVHDQFGNPTLQECMTILVTKSCPMKLLKLVQENCAFLNYERFKNPFHHCVKKNPKLASDLLNACVEDACHYWMLGQLFMKTLVCSYMTSFADTCARNGYNIVWRTDTFCPLYCPPDMPYSAIASPCQSTCQVPKSELCQLSPTEGCQCKEGFLLSGDNCVPEDHCGCQDWSSYVPVGSNYMNHNCSELQQCQFVNNKTSMVTIRQFYCHTDAVCVQLEGAPQCQCKTGYIGDGVRDCYPEPAEKIAVFKDDNYTKDSKNRSITPDAKTPVDKEVNPNEGNVSQKRHISNLNHQKETVGFTSKETRKSSMITRHIKLLKTEDIHSQKRHKRKLKKSGKKKTKKHPPHSSDMYFMLSDNSDEMSGLISNEF